MWERQKKRTDRVYDEVSKEKKFRDIEITVFSGIEHAYLLPLEVSKIYTTLFVSKIVLILFFSFIYCVFVCVCV